MLILPGKFCRSGSTNEVSTLIGNISVLDIFTDSPEQSLKVRRILCKLASSVASGVAKIPTSSAYREHLRAAVLGSTGFLQF